VFSEQIDALLTVDRIIFDTTKLALLRLERWRADSLARGPPHFQDRPRRLARPRTSPFHGGNTGSNPVGDANNPKDLGSIWRRCFMVLRAG
jgi:hypothetical protein